MWDLLAELRSLFTARSVRALRHHDYHKRGRESEGGAVPEEACKGRCGAGRGTALHQGTQWIWPSRTQKCERQPVLRHTDG